MVFFATKKILCCNASLATSSYCALQLCRTWQSRLPSLPPCPCLQTVEPPSCLVAMWIPNTEANSSRAATTFAPFFSQPSIEGWGATPPATCLSSQQSHRTPRPHRWKVARGQEPPAGPSLSAARFERADLKRSARILAIGLKWTKNKKKDKKKTTRLSTKIMKKNKRKNGKNKKRMPKKGLAVCSAQFKKMAKELFQDALLKGGNKKDS